MKKILTLAMGLTLCGLWACAASPQADPSVGQRIQGDQELKRGNFWYQKGCLRKARDYIEAAHRRYCLTDQPGGVARSLNSLANIYQQLGEKENALCFYDAAIAMGRRCNDRIVTGRALANKAAMLIETGALASAESLLDEAEPFSRESDPVFAMVLNLRAVLAIKGQRFHEAEKLLDQADSLLIDDGFNSHASLYYTRGRLMMATENYPQAMHLFQQALTLDRRDGFSRGMADDLLAMADIHERLGQDAAALDCLERSIKIHALLAKPENVLEHLDRLDRLARKTGIDVRVTVHFIDQWLKGEGSDDICR